MTLYFSRLRLSEKPSAKALDRLLVPDEAGRRMDAGHRLLWTVFAEDPEQKRDFMWREERPREFWALSARAPVKNDLFDEVRTTEFAPQLAPGDRLLFKLRANATRTITIGELSTGGKPRRKHLDLVMDKLHPIPGAPPDQKLPLGEKSERAAQRMTIAQEVGRDWIKRKGEAAGFRLIESSDEPDLRFVVADYATVALPREASQAPSARRGRKGQPQFGVMDMQGALEVTDPAAFVPALAAGFGRAKSFGCGLMLIRRAA